MDIVYSPPPMYDRGHRSAVAIACAGAFLAFLDATIVNIAFPDISASFSGSGRDALSWVLDGYFVVIAALLVPAGGLADRFGHKRIFLLGVAGFTAASLLCAVAPSLGLLIAFRVVQGIARGDDRADLAGARPRQLPARATAAGVGLWGAAAAAAAAIGPTLGGALVELSDWRLVFLVNLPLGAAIALRRPRAACASARSVDSRLPDLPGALMLAAGLALVTLAIVEGNDWGWTSAATLGCFAAAAILLAGVVCAQHAATRARSSSRSCSRHALLPPRQPRHPALRRRLLLADPRQRPLPHLDLGLHACSRPAPRRCRARRSRPIVAGPAGKLADRFGHRAVIVPGTLFFAAGVMVLRSAGADARLARPLAARRLPDRHRHRPRLPDPRRPPPSATSPTTASPPPAPSTPPSARSAPCSAPRSWSPSSANRRPSPAALDVSDDAYLFSVFAALVSGAVVLGLRPAASARRPRRRRGRR